MHGCFAALFQGDASGVELATAAHACFLEREGVLPTAENGRILAQHALSRGGPWTGVVIDDFFCLSAEPLSRPPGAVTDSERPVRRAKQGYAREGIRGSDDKDVFGAEVFTVAGAECDSSPSVVKEGLVSVAVPAKKRRVSALMFRRCAMALANEVFSLGVSGFTGELGSRLVPLRPAVRQELVLLAVFAPVLATNVAVPYCKHVFASDASLEKGAYAVASVPTPVAASLWLSADNKGFYTRLDEPWRAALSATSLEPLVAPETPASPPTPQPKKPVGQRFDFLLAGPAPPKLHAALSGLGLGPILDASVSRHLDLCDPDALEYGRCTWSAGRLASLALFLPASGALSVLRQGRRGATARTSRALRAACGLCALFWCAWRNRVPALLVCGGLSSFCSSPRLASLEALAGVVSQRLPLCDSGACHKGTVLVLTSGLSLPSKDPKTACFHGSPPVSSPAKESFGCCPRFLERLVACLSACLLSRPATPVPKSGLESLIVNDLLASGSWRTGPAWNWGEAEHINVLEARAYLKVLRDLSRVATSGTPTLSTLPLLLAPPRKVVARPEP